MHIVLVHPEIPPNTGNIIRLAANTGCDLHLIEPLGFNMQDKHMRRAGLDYHEYANIKLYSGWQAFLEETKPALEHIFAMTTKGSSPFADKRWSYHEDWLVFGSETRGLPADVRDFFPESQRVRLPMLPEQRSLNLSNSVAIAVYEAWRQSGYQGAI